MNQSTTPGNTGLSAAFDALPDGVIVLDEGRRVAFCNAAATTLSGVARADCQGRAFGRFCHDTALNLALIEEMLEAGRTGTALLRAEGGGAVLATLRRLDPAGGIAGHLLHLRDLAVLDYARREAEGRRVSAPLAGVTERRMRPDFARQRNISSWMDRILSRGERAVLQGARVIITGESGVGKTEIARHLHNFVSGSSDPFIAVNCAAIPETLFESELFGYEKGSFTGAAQEGKKGLIEAAEGGTLFLDEIGEIPLTLQAKLLSFLEDGLITRIGGTEARRANVRVISATNRDLLAMAEAREFRLDLYYRLAVVNMPIRPLREMPEILDHLIDRFLAAINRRRPTPLSLSDDLRARLRAYRYPGNIRELWNLLQQISVLGEEEDELPRRLHDAPATAAPGPAPDANEAPEQPLRAAVAKYELALIEEAIRRHGSKRKAAAALGVDVGTISRKTRTTD